MDQRLLDRFTDSMKTFLAHTPAQDVERNLRVFLTSTFAKLNLVTREEFDVQTELLRRTRAKLAKLEARVAEIEGVRRDGTA